MKKAKGKGIAAAPDFFPVPQDPGIRFRHLGLLQDYRDLLKEKDATRKKMEILQQRKLSLFTEVRFLRRRHRYFVDNQISKPQPSKHTVKPNKTSKRKDPMTSTSVSGSNGNKKQKTCNVKRETLPPGHSKERKISKKDDNIAQYSASMNVDLNQRDLLGGGREVALVNSLPAYELPLKQMLYREADATVQHPAPIFDLNQISTEDSRTSNYQQRIEAAYKGLNCSSGGMDDHRNEIDLGVYRNRANMKGLNKVGKRRISWQDQVALRV